MAGQGSNFIIRVQVDDASVQAAQTKLRGLGNFAQTKTIQQTGKTVSQSTQRVSQSAVSSVQNLTKAERAQSIAARQTAEAFGQQNNHLQRTTQYLSNHTQAATRTAAGQLELVRATKQTGIATSDMIRQLVLGDISMRELGSEVSLVATKLLLWTAAATAIGATISVFTRMARAVLEVNEAVTNLERLTSDAGGGFDRMAAVQGVSGLMREYNVSAEEASKATFEAAKSFGNLDDAIGAASTTLLASKVAEIDVAQATQQFTQVSTAFNIAATDQIDILDKLNEQQNTLGVNIGKTLEAVARSANVTKLAGGSLDQLNARTAVGIRFTGFAPETIARANARFAQQILALKGQQKIIASLQGTAAGKSILEEITLPDDPGKLKTDIDLIFRTIGQNFSTLSATQKNAVSEALAGGRQGGLSVIAGSLLENYSLIERQAKISATAQGSAFKEFGFVLKTTKEQIKDVGAEFSAIGAQLEASGILGVVGSLLTLMKSVLGLTNDILTVFNQLPDAVRGVATTFATILAFRGTLNRFNVGESFFSRGGDIRSRRKASAATEASRVRDSEAVVSRVALTQANQASLRVAEKKAALAREETAQARIRQSIEEKFFVRQRTLESRGQIAKINAEAQALGVIPRGQSAIPNVPASQAVSRETALKNIGASEKETAATLESARADVVEARASMEAAASVSLMAASVRAATNHLAGLTTTFRQNADALKKSNVMIGKQVQSGQNVANVQTVLANSSSKLDRENKRGVLSAAGNRALSPGGALIGGLALSSLAGVLQQREPPGRTSVLSSTIGGAGAGLSLGLFGGPAAAAGGFIAGGAIGALSGATQRSKEITKEVDQLNNEIKAFKEQNRDLAAAANRSDKVSIVVTPEEINDVFESVGNLRDVQEALSNGVQVQQTPDRITTGGTGIDAGFPGGAPLIPISELGEPVDKVPNIDKGILDLFQSRDLGLLKRQQVAFGGAASTLQNISEASGDEREKAFSAFVKDDSETRQVLLAVMGNDVKRLEDLQKQISEGGGTPDLERFAALFAALNERVRKETTSKKLFTREALSLSPDEISSAVAETGDGIVSNLEQIKANRDAGIISFSEYNRKVGSVIQTLTRGNKDDPLIQANLKTLQDELLASTNAQIDQLSQQAQVGIVTDDEAAIRSVKVAANAFGRIERGTPGFVEAQIVLGNAINAAIQQQVEDIDTRFRPLLDSAETEGERAALLQQRAAEIDAVRQEVSGIAQSTSDAMVSSLNAASDLGEVAAGQARRYATNIQKLSRLIAQKALIIARSLVGVNADTSSLDKEIDNLRKTLAGGPKKPKRKKEKIPSKGGVPSGQNIADDAKDSGSGSGFGDAGDSFEETAQEILAARFELLKALAGGNDVKVARLALQQAKEEQAFAKTQAEKFRARANVINAERNLRETIFNDRVSDIDFLLQMEKISADEAARRLKKLLKDSKLSKNDRQQLQLKIRQLTNQAKNDRTFGLPTEIPLPSILEIKKIVGVGKQVAAAQITNAQKAFSGLQQQQVVSGSQTVNNNRNTITIVVNNSNDLEKVRKEISKATGSTIKANRYMGSNPGLV